MSELLKTFLDWLERVLPSLITIFGLGYKVGSNGKEKIEQELNKAQLDLKIKENHEKVDRDNANVSPLDGVNKIAGPRD